jgi:hypothetical protein
MAAHHFAVEMVDADCDARTASLYVIQYVVLGVPNVPCEADMCVHGSPTETIDLEMRVCMRTFGSLYIRFICLHASQATASAS